MDLLSTLNPEQQNAVKLVNGPVLVLAGPGSGKTRVLTHRVAYLIHAQNISPRHILAVTFTNKAAREMRERLVQLIGEARVPDLTLGTFHATCARFLRRDGERIGLGRGFVIYDDDDQTALMKQILKELNLDDKKYRPGAVLGAIGKAKNDLIGPDAYVPPSYWHEAVARVYKQYQQKLAENNAVDFDDLIMETVRLLRENADILERYQNRYIYLHVDEFQDTNVAQYVLIKLLADKHQNLFCVGDEDQSVYRFRGADYRNVMRLREDFPNARVVLLEQNYRSTKTILDAAQAVIRKNQTRHAKNLWTENARGIPVSVVEGYNEEEEAQIVVDEIARLVRTDDPSGRLYHPRDIAVFYRTNAQSRVLEDQFVRRGMAYRLVGAMRFYQRREAKDLLAYLRLAYNPGDGVAFYRVINVPTRGIGKKTIEDLQYWSQRLDEVPYAVLQRLRQQTADDRPQTAQTTADGRRRTVDSGGQRSAGSGHPTAVSGQRLDVLPFDARTTKALLGFLDRLDELRAAQAEKKLTELFDFVLARTGYETYVRDGTPEGEDRWANVVELRGVTQQYAGDTAAATLPPFLEQVALVADIDSYDEQIDAPTLMTLHTAKGLEFPVVFIVGLEEGLFPHARSFEDPAEMEEERRLCYVGITRAKERVYLLHAFRRAYYANSDVSEPSRFLRDIPRELVTGKGAAAQGGAGDAGTRGHGAAETRRHGDAGTRRRGDTGLRRHGDTETRGRGEEIRKSQSATRTLRFRAGDKVRHARFGSGVVISSKALGEDEEVEVAFVGKGVRKLLASLAGLNKS